MPSGNTALRTEARPISRAAAAARMWDRLSEVSVSTVWAARSRNGQDWRVGREVPPIEHRIHQVWRTVEDAEVDRAAKLGRQLVTKGFFRVACHSVVGSSKATPAHAVAACLCRRGGETLWRRQPREPVPPNCGRCKVPARERPEQAASNLVVPLDDPIPSKTTQPVGYEPGLGANGVRRTRLESPAR